MKDKKDKSSNPIEIINEFNQADESELVEYAYRSYLRRLFQKNPLVFIIGGISVLAIFLSLIIFPGYRWLANQYFLEDLNEAQNQTATQLAKTKAVQATIDADMPKLNPETLTALAPTNTRTPTPILTPTLTPTPTLTFTLTPTKDPFGEADKKNDGLNCATGEKASTALPAHIDISRVSARSVVEGEACYYLFTIELAQAPPEGKKFWGGIEIYDPGVSLLTPADPDWHFNNTGNHSFNFYWDGSSLQVMFAYVTQDGSGWETAEIPGYSGSVDGNRIVLKIPCDSLDGLSEESTWFATTTTGSFDICDSAGIGADGMPGLFIPTPVYTGP